MGGPLPWDSFATERIREGLAVARRRGIKLGRPTKLNAYREDIARRRAIGRTGRAIAAELSLPVGSVFQVSESSGSPHDAVFLRLPLSLVRKQ